MKTPDELRRVHIALEQAGSITGAASLLGITKASLKEMMDVHPELKSYLPAATVPTEVETIARKPLPPVETEEAATVAAMKAADIQVRNGFEAIGVTGDALQEAMAFKEFGRLHFQDMRHYIGGGMAKLFADLMSEAKDIRREIESEGDMEREKMLREDRSRVVKHAIDVYDRVREASLTAAVIEAKKQEAKEKKKGGRTAFAPLAMKVEGNVTVNNPPQE